MAVLAAVLAGRTAIDSSLTSFQSQVPAFTAGEASAPAAVAWTGVEPTGIAPGLPTAQSAAPADVLIPAQGEPTARESAASFQMEVGAEPLSGPLPSPELVRPLLDVAGALTQLALDVPLPPPAIIDHLAQALREQRLYSVYEIQQGDTLTAIAQRFGLSIDSLLWNNNELRDHPDYLKPGEELLVPATDGIVYNVKLGDTLLDIAATYNVDVEEIVGFRANNLSGPEDLKDGAVLLLPGARPPALGLGQLAVASSPTSPQDSSPAPTAATGPGYDGLLSVGAPVQVAGTGSCLNARAQPGGDTINACLAEGFVGTVADGPRYVNGYWWWQIEGQGWSVDNYLRLYDGTAPATTGPVSNSGFIWPVSGSITDGFGVPRGGNAYHTGIDIDVPDGSHTAVAAAAGGRVVFVAQRSYGYGYHVIIDHGDGFETLYAHLSSIAVEVGQQVSQGALIGYTGCTGYCTGEHLHFEVRKGGAPVNPLSYLP